MENYNENYDFTPSPEIVRYKSQRELSNLSQNYWQVADEANLENVQNQIDHLIEPAFETENIIKPQQSSNESVREIMLDDLEKMINNYGQKRSIFKLFRQ